MLNILTNEDKPLALFLSALSRFHDFLHNWHYVRGFGESIICHQYKWVLEDALHSLWIIDHVWRNITNIELSSISCFGYRFHCLRIINRYYGFLSEPKIQVSNGFGKKLIIKRYHCHLFEIVLCLDLFGGFFEQGNHIFEAAL